MDKKAFLNDIKSKMDSAFKVLEDNYKGLRMGRASVNVLDPVRVDVYGQKMPIQSLATVTTPDARTILIQAWDKSSVKPIEKAITDANLGFNPISEAQTIRINMPQMTEERRKEVVLVVHKYAENAKIATRNVRRDGLDVAKKLEKDSKISKDDLHNLEKEVQKVIDDITVKIDNLAKTKEKEVLSI